MKKERSTTRNATNHPLQIIRTTCGLTQQEFADRLGISVSALSKREAFTEGYEDIPDHLRHKLLRDFGAVILTDVEKKPGEPGYYVQVFNGDFKPFTKDYWDQHQHESGPPPKHSVADVLAALAVVGTLSGRFRREAQFVNDLALSVRSLCASPIFKIELARQTQRLIDEKKFAPASWLGDILEDDALRQQIPVLPSQLEKQLRLIKAVQEKSGRRGHVVANGNKIDLAKPIKKSDLLPLPLSAAPHPSGKKKAR